MKKTLLLLVTIISVLGVSAQTIVYPIPNAGFESWQPVTGVVSYEEPSLWRTTDTISAFTLNQNDITVRKYSGLKHAGNYSMLLQTVKLSNNMGGALPENLPGIAAICNYTYEMFDSTNTFGGWKTNFSKFPNKLRGYYAYSTPSGSTDSATIIFVARSARTPFASALALLPKTDINSLHYFETPVVNYDPTGTVVSDSAIMKIASANFRDISQATPGSVLAVDDLELVYDPNVSVYDTYNTAKVDISNNGTSQLMINSNEGYALKFELISMSGQSAVVETIDPQQSVRISTLDLATGVYLYSFKNKENVLVKAGKIGIN